MTRVISVSAIALMVAVTLGAQQPAAPHAEHAAGPAQAETQDFVNKAGMAGLAEVQLGKMAAERGSHADVKAFGQMMVKDHSQGNMDLAAAAAKAGVQVPTQLDQEHRDMEMKLSKLQGADFDREYMTAMVQGHEKVESLLRERVNADASGEGRAATAGDKAVTQWAAKAVTRVKMHLERAKQVQQSVK